MSIFLKTGSHGCVNMHVAQDQRRWWF